MILTASTRTVDVHIRTLRSKLGSCGDYVETVRGVGYRMGGADMRRRIFRLHFHVPRCWLLFLPQPSSSAFFTCSSTLR